MAGRLLLRDRIFVARAVFTRAQGRPDYLLQHELLDVESVLSPDGNGHVADPSERYLEAEIRRVAAPYLDLQPDARPRT